MNNRSTISLVGTVMLVVLTTMAQPRVQAESTVGQPADIAPSAYVYRADRAPADNAPESWLALMRYAGQPLNKPADLSDPAMKRVLCGLLWEEIRPMQRLELTWAEHDQRQPSPTNIVLTVLSHQGTASSWWNNLASVRKELQPTLSADGKTYVYDLQTDSCGLVISVGTATASEWAVPSVRVLVSARWKQMDLEIEWGFQRGPQDYSGTIQVYDGRLTGLAPLASDRETRVLTPDLWRSEREGSPRRGVKASLLYMGTSKWRRVQPFTSQPADVARTIVTVWTKAGNFSFLAGDLENGPVLAPEYGFFVRRTSDVLSVDEPKTSPDLRRPRILLTDKMRSIAGNAGLLGWGSDATPWFGGNPTDESVNAQGIGFPPRTLAMHPGSGLDVAVGWRSDSKASVRVEAGLTHAQSGSNGVEWWITRESKTDRKTLAHGLTEGTGSVKIPSDTEVQALGQVSVDPGDVISLVIGPKGAHECDTTLIELIISELGGSGRVWSLRQDVLGGLHAGNPHADGQGRADVWLFYCEKPSAPQDMPSEPPIHLASRASSAREFIEELQRKGLYTIRQQTRTHQEQTWLGAVRAMRGTNLPAHPAPPPGLEPAMQVQVPSARLTAQWNLGAWHLTRHAQKHPQTGRLWFNDHPYGILAAETYMVLAALDLMGSHQAAADGYEQWVSLPMDPTTRDHPEQHHPWALPDRPNGLFSEGHGCMTHAEGPPGAGGHMDGVHAFGPGSIGWALVEHYRLTGDDKWFKASAPRMKANAEWMLRQRRVVKDMVPGGERLWCKGLQPALQVTPDSGGMWMQFYECEAYYWVSVAHFAEALATIDPQEGARLQAEAEGYRRDLRAAVERSIALSPVVPVRDGTFHSVIPFACYVRGLSTGAWGWLRDGSGAHVGPLYWETVQSAAALISPAGLLSPQDVRVQGYLDVLEDRLLLENTYVGNRDWFAAGWQYQGGLERTANMHLAADDVPVFLRSFLNCYAVDILPNDGYIFNEHAVHGPPDKIFEEAAFLERLRNLLVMEQGDLLWLARATPRAWLEQGKRISVRNAPTYFGTLAYEITSHVENGQIHATVEIPTRKPPKSALLRLRHPSAAPIRRVTVNGKNWSGFDRAQELIRLEGVQGTVVVVAEY
jgi:hypothetical protein